MTVPVGHWPKALGISSSEPTTVNTKTCQSRVINSPNLCSRSTSPHGRRAALYLSEGGRPRDSAGERTTFAARVEGRKSKCNYMMQSYDAERSYVSTVFALGAINEGRSFGRIRKLRTLWADTVATGTRIAQLLDHVINGIAQLRRVTRREGPLKCSQKGR
jgi:hypothetical protein